MVFQAQQVDWHKEWLKCSLSPLYFMVTYGGVLDDELGAIPFTPYPHLIKALEVIESSRFSIFLKSRQIGFTQLMAHYALWMALFHQASNVIILSKSEETANKTVTYAKHILKNLPDALRLPLLRDQASLLSFPAMESELRTCSATASAGNGIGSARLGILDEFDFHEYARQNYIEILPMVGAGGNRKLIIGSAPNVLQPESKFKEVYREAKQHLNNFAPMFIPYDVMPYRNQEWYEGERKNYDTLAMVTRYPKTEEEALTSARDLCRFDVASLNELINDARSWRPLEERQNGIIKIYKKPVAGRKYCMTVDSSEGGADPSVGLVFDWQTDEEVAEFCGRISVDEQSRIIWDLYREYNEAYLAPERNSDGRRLIEKLQGFGIKNFYYELDDKKHEKPGWWTSGKNRPVMIGELADSVARKDFRLHNPAALEQFFYFIRTPGKPDGEATKGANDDYVMAMAINRQIRKSMPTGQGISVYHYKYNG